MRITASWSGSSPTEYKDVARMFVHRTRGCPRTSSTKPQQGCRRARTRQGPSPCGWRYAPILDRFCARRLYAIVDRDEETACPGRTKKLRDAKMDRTLRHPLDKIRPGLNCQD